jgi:hypothetical protein
MTDLSKATRAQIVQAVAKLKAEQTTKKGENR